jgi:hypothetical protein
MELAEIDVGQFPTAGMQQASSARLVGRDGRECNPGDRHDDAFKVDV